MSDRLATCSLIAVMTILLAAAPPAARAAAPPSAPPPSAAAPAAAPPSAAAPTAPASTASPETVRWFQATEQALMDAVATGDKAVWERVLDDGCVYTSEEGEVLGKRPVIDSLKGLPSGLSGTIVVKEVTVEEYPAFAVVHYLADEMEMVFGQRLVTKYRSTDTFRRDGKSWKMVATHTSVVTADPPPQPVPAAIAAAVWPSFVGTYRLLPNGWTFTVELRDGTLYAGRDPQKLKPLVPLTSNAFVLSGSLGDLIFATGPDGKVTHILEFRKFEPLVWTRVDTPSAAAPPSSSPHGP